MEELQAKKINCSSIDKTEVDERIVELSKTTCIGDKNNSHKWLVCGDVLCSTCFYSHKKTSLVDADLVLGSRGHKSTKVSLLFPW